MRNTVKALTVAAILAGSFVASTGNAQAAGISPITSQVKGKQYAPTCHHPRCAPKPAPSHGPFVVKPRGPIGGPVLR